MSELMSAHKEGFQLSEVSKQGWGSNNLPDTRGVQCLVRVGIEGCKRQTQMTKITFDPEKR
jgi:hypothetical protein